MRSIAARTTVLRYRTATRSTTPDFALGKVYLIFLDATRVLGLAVLKTQITLSDNLLVTLSFFLSFTPPYFSSKAGTIFTIICCVKIPPAEAGHESLYVVLPVMGDDVWLPEILLHMPVELIPVPSPFVPDTAHDVTFCADQEMVEVSPWRTSVG